MKLQFFKLAFYFESSLVLVALLTGWLLGIDPFRFLVFGWSALAWGIVGTLPLFVLFMMLYQARAKSLRQIKEILAENLAPHLNACSRDQLVVLAAIAGLSEELLFRGVLQPWLESMNGYVFGLIGSNLLFGLAHFVTPLYALLAGLIGIYLGLFMDIDEQRNLLIPMLIHGLYDYLAFLVVLHSFRTGRNR